MVLRTTTTKATCEAQRLDGGCRRGHDRCPLPNALRRQFQARPFHFLFQPQDVWLSVRVAVGVAQKPLVSRQGVLSRLLPWSKHHAMPKFKQLFWTQRSTAISITGLWSAVSVASLLLTPRSVSSLLRDAMLTSNELVNVGPGQPPLSPAESALSCLPRYGL